VAAAIVDAMNDSAAATKDQRAGPVFYRFQRSFIGLYLLKEASLKMLSKQTKCTAVTTKHIAKLKDLCCH